MKIAAPLNSADDVAALVSAGADEFYCGVMDLNAAPGYFPNARVPVKASFRSFSDLGRAVALSREKAVPVLFCANAFHGRRQTERLKEDILRACRAGVSGVIVADPFLLPWLRNSIGDRTIVVSTMAGNLNSKILDFYAAAGANRVVLDRLMTLGEISALAAHAAAKGMEVEAFVVHPNCFHINALCQYHKWFVDELGDEEPGLNKVPPCRRTLHLEVWEKSGGAFRRKDAGLEFCASNPWPVCAACSLYRLKAVGVAYAKVEGRSLPLEKNVKAVSLIRQCLSLLKSGGLEEKDFVEAAVKLYETCHGEKCDFRRCFYYETYSRRRPALDLPA